jgi:hypothetical protein
MRTVAAQPIRTGRLSLLPLRLDHAGGGERRWQLALVD